LAVGIFIITLKEKARSNATNINMRMTEIMSG